MKLDANVLRYLSREEFRVLTAVEMGMKNHELVPAELVDKIAGLKTGGAFKNMRTLLRHKLVHHDSSKYDGYRLTTLGYDFLAIKTMVNRGLIVGVGRQIGVGKESDIFEVVTEDGKTLALKLHRLGRTSFRAVKSKRDYLRHRSSYSWLYLSRLAALKEFAFMKALSEHGFPVPEAVEWNRHCVLMSLIPGYPLVQVKELTSPAVAFETIIGLIVRLAQHGLIHCDFNEFNLMIDDEENITMIDFPQMVSVSHRNAEMYFDRDVACIYKFFLKRFNYAPAENRGETENQEDDESDAEDNIRPAFQNITCEAGFLDKELAASGFTHQNQEVLDRFIEAKGDEENHENEEEDDEDEENESNDGSEKETEARQGNVETVEQEVAEASNGNDNEGTEDEDEDDEAAEQTPRGSEKRPVDKRMQKQRRRAAAAVRGGNSKSLHLSRNANKDKTGRRTRHAKGSMDF